MTHIYIIPHHDIRLDLWVQAVRDPLDVSYKRLHTNVLSMDFFDRLEKSGETTCLHTYIHMHTSKESPREAALLVWHEGIDV